MKKAIQGIHLYVFGGLRKLYDWVLSWAEKKYSQWALFWLAFAESSFFPIPPDVLQVALSVAKPKRSFIFAAIATIGSVLGGILGYLIGAFFFETVGMAIIEALHYQEAFDKVGNLYQEFALIAIMVSAFTPIPYKVFTISAGVWGIGLPVLILGSLIGRAGRFFLVGTLIYFFGPKIQEFIDKYFNILTIVFMVLLIGGFVLIKYAI